MIVNGFHTNNCHRVHPNLGYKYNNLQQQENGTSYNRWQSNHNIYKKNEDIDGPSIHSCQKRASIIISEMITYFDNNHDHI